MLAEAIKYAAARLLGQGDPHGHLAQQVALWARHRRRRAAWEPHLSRCRALTLAAAKACPPEARRTALVMGSGLLLEVPLEELSALFQRVVLADMAFVPEVRARAARQGNVELRETDLTGCLDRLSGGLPRPLPDALAQLGAGLPGLDFAYSANLLSQLPLFALGKAVRLEAAAALVRQHLDGLKALGVPACLVTDVAERGLRQGLVEYEADLLFGVDPGLSGETWTWSMAPDGEAVRGLDVERTVLGVADVRNV
ncbi:MAG: hypothetical protein KKA55_00650 [Proteobacteria bacterium]|nr:hypothetical protein [Pseudomonadota bacterium]MBU1594025.1 hypothetical protein [Pseudomonadota bacterium]